MNPYHRLVVFVDWNSQIIASKTGRGDSDPLRVAGKVLQRVARDVARVLSLQFSEQRFLVDLRLYHGWHRGFEPTINRKAIASAIAATDFSALSPRSNVVFSGEAQYGDCLLTALPRRIHERLAIHLPNTLRSQDKRRELVEKMVDTALAADLVSMAAREPSTWLMVVAEDDDMVPPLFVAEALLGSGGAKALLLRGDLRSGPFLKLDDLLCGGQP